MHITGAQWTCQRALREIKIGDVVTKLADVRREREALVAVKSAFAYVAFCLHADNLEWQLS